MMRFIREIAARACKVAGILVFTLALVVGSTPFASSAQASQGYDPVECADDCYLYFFECRESRPNDPMADRYCELVVWRCIAKCYEQAIQ